MTPWRDSTGIWSDVNTDLGCLRNLSHTSQQRDSCSLFSHDIVTYKWSSEPRFFGVVFYPSSSPYIILYAVFFRSTEWGSLSENGSRREHKSALCTTYLFHAYILTASWYTRTIIYPIKRSTKKRIKRGINVASFRNPRPTSSSACCSLLFGGGAISWLRRRQRNKPYEFRAPLLVFICLVLSRVSWGFPGAQGEREHTYHLGYCFWQAPAYTQCSGGDEAFTLCHHMYTRWSN
jgi:hypothetical protein